MNTIRLSAWVFLLYCLCFAPGHAVAADNETGQVIATLERLAQATIKRDVATLRKLYRDDLIYSHSIPENRVDNKEQVLKDVAESSYSREWMKFPDMNVRFYGPVAIAKGVWTIRGGEPGKMREVRLNVLWVLVKGAEGWQVAYRQPTPLSPDPASHK